ncbi:hypothetical protein DRO97_06370 [Archaeoglobales archaeon]|nr:MAG: hypothetical protein DRO97_06370 [Archaeoglobales archaeon]
MKAYVLFTSHRVEFLEHFESEAMKYDVIVLEEPKNDRLFEYFDGKITRDEYVKSLDTSFPHYTLLHLELLRRLHKKGKKILQIEPYLEKLNKIYELIEKGEVGGDPVVREVERKVTRAWIEYQEAFMKKDFDELVEKTIEYTKVDAERFKVRDEMRAEKIVELDGEVLVEAGQIHILLPIFLMERGCEVLTKSIPNEIAKNLGYEWSFNPGSELTKKYMLNEDVKDEKLIAARALIYISMISKKEILPSEKEKYPHLMDEIKVVSFVNKLNYNDCKKLFEKIWH